MADEKEPPYFNATVSITPPAGLDPTMVPPYRTISSRSPYGEKGPAPHAQGYSLHFPMGYTMTPPPVYRPNLSTYPPGGVGSIHYPHCSKT